MGGGFVWWSVSVTIFQYVDKQQRSGRRISQLAGLTPQNSFGFDQSVVNLQKADKIAQVCNL